MCQRWPEAGWPAIATRRPSASCAAGSATDARDARCGGCAGTRRASASIHRQRSRLPAWRGVVRTAAPPPDMSGARGLPTRRAPREPWAMTSTASPARVAHGALARRTRFENRRRKSGQSNRVLPDSDRRPHLRARRSDSSKQEARPPRSEGLPRAAEDPAGRSRRWTRRGGARRPTTGRRSATERRGPRRRASTL